MFESLAKSWLSLQCGMLPGVKGALVALGTDRADGLAVAASWPEGLPPTPALQAAGKRAMGERSPVVSADQAERAPAEPRATILACPLHNGTGVVGAVAVELDAADEAQRHAALQLLKWGAALLEFMLHQGAGSVAAGRLAALVEATRAALEPRRCRAAATAAATHLAHSLASERVSIGLLQRGHVRVVALSQTATPDPRSSPIRDLEAAMDEALDAKDTILYPEGLYPEGLYPGGPSGGASLAHERLARRQEDRSACTVVLPGDGRAVGALTLERVRGPEFDASTVELIESAAALLGPVLWLKRMEERSIASRVSAAALGFLGRLVGPRGLGTKVSFLSVVALLGFLGLGTGEYRISGDASLEGSVHRALVAPIDGYVKRAEARAGQVVERGEVLASLAREPLELERRRWASERDELAKQHRRALAELDRAQAKILQAQMERASAELALVDEQLSRTRIVAPFDGIVVTGDLSHSVGAPVTRGQVLFELAPLDSYRMVLEVDESDIAAVSTGQRGQLALAALPGERYPFVVEQVIGVAQSVDSRNVFRVEARLEATSPNLRPGMHGVGKIYAERRNLLWIWAHGLVDRAGLWLWARLP